MSVLQAEVELAFLNAKVGRGKSIVSEVGKAITVAQLNRGVEARVICDNGGDFLQAHVLLSSKTSSDVGLKFSPDTDMYELPNGSAVSVHFEAKRSEVT